MKRFLLGILTICVLGLGCSNKGSEPEPPPPVVNNAPVFTGYNYPTFMEGDSDTVKVAAFDEDGDLLRFTFNFSNFEGLPTHDIIQRNDSLYLNITFDFEGQWSSINSPFELNVYVSDGELSDTLQLTVIVRDFVVPNRAPQLQYISSRTISLGDTLNLPVSATDPDQDQIFLSAQFDFTGATFTDFGNGSGTFEFIPFDVGVYSVMFIASDGELADSLTVTITVIDPNTPSTELAWDSGPEWLLPFRTNVILYHAVWFDVTEFGLSYPINLSDVNVYLPGDQLTNFFITYEDSEGVPDLSSPIFNGLLMNMDTSGQWINSSTGIDVEITQPFFIVLEGADGTGIAGDLGDMEGGEFQDASITYLNGTEGWGWYFIIWWYEDNGNQVWIGKSDYCARALVSSNAGSSVISSKTSIPLKGTPTTTVNINQEN